MVLSVIYVISTHTPSNHNRGMCWSYVLDGLFPLACRKGHPWFPKHILQCEMLFMHGLQDRALTCSNELCLLTMASKVFQSLFHRIMRDQRSEGFNVGFCPWTSCAESSPDSLNVLMMSCASDTQIHCNCASKNVVLKLLDHLQSDQKNPCLWTCGLSLLKMLH